MINPADCRSWPCTAPEFGARTVTCDLDGPAHAPGSSRFTALRLLYLIVIRVFGWLVLLDCGQTFQGHGDHGVRLTRRRCQASTVPVVTVAGRQLIGYVPRWDGQAGQDIASPASRSPAGAWVTRGHWSASDDANACQPAQPSGRDDRAAPRASARPHY
jgi:hypothetical protein